MLAPLLQAEAQFVSAPKHAIKVEAASFYVLIAEVVDLADTTAWDSLIKGMARGASSTDEEVRKILHTGTITISSSFLSRNPPDTIVKALLADCLPFYFVGATPDDRFYAQAVAFLNRVVDDLIIVFWDSVFSQHFALVLRLLFSAIGHADDGLSAAGINVFLRFIKAFGDRFGDPEFQVMLEALRKVNITRFTPSNAKAFVAAVGTLVALANRREFLEIIQGIDLVCQGDERLVNLGAFVRQSLLEVVLSVGVDAEIVECVRGTLAFFVEKGFAKNASAEPGRSWNETVSLATAKIADLPDELFIKCFDASAPFFVEFVLADSVELRRHVKVVVKRRFLG
jgi:hypothetical protein